MTDNPPCAVALRPGDSCLITLAQQDVDMVQVEDMRAKLIERFPGVEFTFISGVTGLAVYRSEEPCECSPNAICADHLCPCGCGDPELTRGAQESLDVYRHRVVEHDRAYIRRKIGGGP